MKRITICCMLIITLGCILTACSGDSLNVADAVAVNFTGFNGSGEAHLSGTDDWMDLLTFDENTTKLEKLAILVDLEDAVTYTLNPAEGLSNGDTVILTVVVDSNALERYGYSARSTTKKLTVSGLKELTAYDPFEDVDLSITGVKQYGRLTLEPKQRVLEGLTYSADRTEKLNNGDIITITVVAPKGEDVVKYCAKRGYSITNTTMEMEVSGLSDPETYDPFEHLTVTAIGSAPYATLDLYVWTSSLEGLTFTADRDRDLSNGDVVTLTVRGPSGKDLTEYCMEQGYQITRTTMEYTVSTEASYLQSIDQIPAELMAQMQKKAEEILVTKFEDSTPKNDSTYTYTGVKQLLDYEYAGCYFLTLKNSAFLDDSTAGNKIIMIYKLTATSTEGDFEYYYAVRFNNVMRSGDDTYTADLTNYGSTGKTFTNGYYKRTYGSWLKFTDKCDQKYYGYTDLETFRTQELIELIGKYDYTTDVAQ